MTLPIFADLAARRPLASLNRRKDQQTLASWLLGGKRSRALGLVVVIWQNHNYVSGFVKGFNFGGRRSHPEKANPASRTRQMTVARQPSRAGGYGGARGAGLCARPEKGSIGYWVYLC